MYGGPLSPYVKQYAESLCSEGYPPEGIHRRLRFFVTFNRWLQQTGRNLSSLDESTARVFAESQLYRPDAGPQPIYVLQGILALLRQWGAIAPAKETPLTPVQRLVADYRDFLVKERALSERTSATWGPVNEKFLREKFGGGPVSRLKRIKPVDVIEFVQRHAHKHSPARATIMISALRSLLHYLYYKGLTVRNLSGAVPRVARWSCSNLPRYLSAVQVRQILQHCDRGTPLGRRDYAVLLLLARLGLRACEVAWLNLEDIDWQNATITIHGKGGRIAQLPLPADAGQAVARYLRRDRQPCACRRVFIRRRAPMDGLGRANIAVIVRRAIDRAGIVAPHKGAHVLRHSLATTMLRSGKSLDEIGEMLRHQSWDSTLVYAKVDIEALRQLALQWPEGAQ